jgi:RNA polymerase sigma-70 factor (ECF subfamily)
VDESALEAEIMQLLERGRLDEAASRAIRAFGSGVFGYLVTLLGDRSQADEAFAQMCEAMWRALPGFRGESRVKTWLYGIAWNVASHARRDARRKRAQPLDSNQAEKLAEAQRTATATWQKTAARDRLAKVRAQLSHEEQSLLILRLDRQLSFLEVGQVLGLDEPTARKRFERLKKKLQTLVASG